MMRMVVFVICMVMAAPLWAVEPDEILSDPALETRAREISKGLRCLVCRNENIDSSNAGIAKDLRLLVRERLVAGDSDGQVVDFIVDRYGEYVLLKPPFSASNAILWLIGPLLLVIGAIVAMIFVRRRSGDVRPPVALDESEEIRLAEILGTKNKG